MSPKKQVQLSSLCLAVMILIIFGYGLLIFYVPILLESYLTAGVALSPFLRFVVAIGRIINSVELLFVPTMLLAFVGSIIWRIQSSRKISHSSD